MTTYAGVTGVVSRLQLMDPKTNQRKVLTELTNPRASEVESRILAFEDYVDMFCRDQWRIKASQLEYYSSDPMWTNWYPFEIKTWVYGHKLQNFDKSKGDILMVKRGREWHDLLSEPYKEGEYNDFWVEYDTGIIHFQATRPSYGPQTIKVQYRWGHEEVPHTIRRAVENLVAADILKSEIYTVIAGDGAGFVTNRTNTARAWEEEAHDLLRRHQRIPTRTLGM